MSKPLTYLIIAACVAVLARFAPEMVVKPASTFVQQLRSGDLAAEDEGISTIGNIRDNLKKLLR